MQASERFDIQGRQYKPSPVVQKKLEQRNLWETVVLIGYRADFPGRDDPYSCFCSRCIRFGRCHLARGHIRTPPNSLAREFLAWCFPSPG